MIPLPPGAERIIDGAVRAPHIWLWATSTVLFLLGACCMILRRQLLAMVLGLELMINAANLNIVYYAAQRGDPAGLAVAFLVIAVAAAEVVVGLSFLLALHHDGLGTETDGLRGLSG